MTTQAVFAPTGWGFRPGFMLAGDDAAVEAALPDLPLLGQLQPGTRGLTVTRALLTVPGIVPMVRPRHLCRRYGIAQATASDAIKRALAAMFTKQ